MTQIDEIKTWLRTMVQYRRQYCADQIAKSGWKYSSPDEFFLEHAIEMFPCKHPPRVRKGKSKQCYFNTSLLIQQECARRDNWLYCEGYVLGCAIIPIQHSWVYVPGQGVIDNTLNDKENVWFGIAFQREWYFRHILDTGFYGVFATDFIFSAQEKLLRGEFDPKEVFGG